LVLLPAALSFSLLWFYSLVHSGFVGTVSFWGSVASFPWARFLNGLPHFEYKIGVSFYLMVRAMFPERAVENIVTPKLPRQVPENAQLHTMPALTRATFCH
jgi:hypothetical protein